MNKVAALVLAAGEGRRFGGSKLLAHLGGRALLSWPIEAAAREGLDPIVVVVGGDPGVRAELSRLEPQPHVKAVENPDWSRGISTSLQRGLGFLGDLPENIDSVCILLGDQPGIGPSVVHRLVAAADRDSVVVATFGGQRRNPVVLGAEWWSAATRLTGDTGLRALFDDLPITEVACDELGDPTDVDEPGDLVRLERRFGHETGGAHGRTS